MTKINKEFLNDLFRDMGKGMYTQPGHMDIFRQREANGTLTMPRLGKDEALRDKFEEYREGGTRSNSIADKGSTDAILGAIVETMFHKDYFNTYPLVEAGRKSAALKSISEEILTDEGLAKVFDYMSEKAPLSAYGCTKGMSEMLNKLPTKALEAIKEHSVMENGSPNTMSYVAQEVINNRNQGINR